LFSVSDTVPAAGCSSSICILQYHLPVPSAIGLRVRAVAETIGAVATGWGREWGGHKSHGRVSLELHSRVRGASMRPYRACSRVAGGGQWRSTGGGRRRWTKNQVLGERETLECCVDSSFSYSLPSRFCLIYRLLYIFIFICLLRVINAPIGSLGLITS
jgi:hypothetical protein